MDTLSNLFGKKKQTQPKEQAVIIHFQYNHNDLAPLQVLDDRLKTSIEDAKVGDYDGNEIAANMRDGFLYMYSPDAEKLFQVISPIIQSTSFMNGASVKLLMGHLGSV